MLHLICDKLTKGLRTSERTVAIKDWQGRTHFLRVEYDFLNHEGGREWLPVGKVSEDRGRGLVLVELPQESESGVNRLWVPESSLLEYVQTPA
jgi:hypothetical protein